MMKTTKYNKFFVETNFKKSRKFRIKTYLTLDKNKTRHIDSWFVFPPFIIPPFIFYLERDRHIKY
jgi:hypothetical protein